MKMLSFYRIELIDATCVDNPAPSHLPSSSSCAGAAAAATEIKRRKYNYHDRNYIFEPFRIRVLITRLKIC